MKIQAIILCPAFVLLSGTASIALPKKEPVTKYTTLWTNSPFTVKPEAPPPGPVVNPLEDYALGGVSPVGDGYRVTLLNRKNPEERIVMQGDKPNKDGFKINSVERKPGGPLKTTVSVSKGTVTGTVEFDETLLTLKAPPAQAPPPQQQNLPPGVNPGQPNNPQQAGGQRQPRPRVVQPPNPATGQPQNPQQQYQQQQQQRQQQYQQQGGQPQNQQRPDRRRR